MNKGYKLQNITITTYTKKGNEIKEETINNSNITPGTYARTYSTRYPNGDIYYSSCLEACTIITVTYTDKYTQQECKTVYSISCLAK